MGGCLLYQVTGTIGIQSVDRSGPQPIRWLFVSPSAVFEQTDKMLWNRLQRAGYFQGQLELAARESSWSHLFARHVQVYSQTVRLEAQAGCTFPTAQERRRLWQAFSQVNRAGVGERNDAMGSGERLVDKRLLQALYPMLAGRQLLLSEVEQVAREQLEQEDDWECHLLEALQLGYLQGLFEWLPSMVLCRRSGWFGQGRRFGKRPALLGKRPLLWQCLRCGSCEVVAVACASCGRDDCAYCPQCLVMGRVKACQPLLRWEAHQPTALDSGDPDVESARDAEGPVVCTWQGTLSPGQQTASNALLRFVQDAGDQAEAEAEHKQPEFLVWAVCGAGKTEMLFDMLTYVLNKDQKVLITSPRRDVILELAPRLKEAYPMVPIRVLYGGSGERFKPGQLFLATTHQTLRFARYFDLIIIDEEDAFPYHHDPMLPLAVSRARRETGQTVYLTATPRTEMVKRVKRGELPYVLIPQRFHGQPLAVPKLRPVGRWRHRIKQGEKLTALMDYLFHLLENNRYGFLFVPHVGDIEQVGRYITEELLPFMRATWPELFPAESPFTMEGVHAEHPERADIVLRFRRHEIRLLITTTILERGVTISYSDVAVLGSDDDVFDTAALIQIAGRVGRKKEDPVGQVWFLPEMRTKTQQQAIRQIREWNRLARQLGGGPQGSGRPVGDDAHG